MKISYLGTDGIPAKYGGFETCVEEIGTRLADRGHDVTVYCKSVNPSGESKEYKGVRLVHFPKIRTQALDYAYNAILPTLHASATKGGILHYFGCDQVPLTFLARVLGGRVLLSLDGLEWERNSYPWVFRAYLRSFAELAMVFPRMSTVDSRRSERWYFERTGRMPNYVPYGVSVSDAVDPEVLARYGLKSRQYVLFVGRLVYEKGAHTIMEAFRKVDTDLRLVVVGGSRKPGTYVENLKNIADDRSLFLGFVHGKEYETLRNAALIYVHPSLFDGTSISLLGALAAGKGIVSSDIADNVAVAGDAAIYFRTEDPCDLAGRLQELIDNPSKIAVLEEKARARAREAFDWDGITDEYERLYGRLEKK